MVNRIKHDSESKRTQIKNMNKHVFICLFIFFVCVLQDSLSCLILIYRKWPIGRKGIARGATAVNDLMFNVIYSNLKHCFFWKQKNGIWKSDENRTRCGIFVNKKLDQDPPTPHPSLQILITVHTFFSDTYKNVKLENYH